MKHGDRIKITSGGRTVGGSVNRISEDGRTAFVSFDGALAIGGGGTVFSNAALKIGDDGRWREAASGALLDVTII